MKGEGRNIGRERGGERENGSGREGEGETE